jgi:Spy/CpxP family protein refolding chaperone
MKVGTAIASILLAGMVFAQEPGNGPGMGFGEHRPPFERAMGGPGDHGRWWNNPKAVERLKLTDSQRKAMDDTLQEHRETLIDLRGSLEKAELELEPMMKADQPNETQVLAQIDKVAQARAELEKANARFLLAIRGKLTPDQWKQMQADRASRPRGEWGRGPGSRRGQLPAAPDGQNAPPPPPGPQGMIDGRPGGGPGPDAFPPADGEATGGEQ